LRMPRILAATTPMRVLLIIITTTNSLAGRFMAGISEGGSPISALVRTWHVCEGLGHDSNIATLIRENENVRRAILNARGLEGLNSILRQKTSQQSGLRKKSGSVLAGADNPANLVSASRRLPEHKKKIGRTGARTSKGVRNLHEDGALLLPRDADQT
jgi:hypothetical protein